MPRTIGIRISIVFLCLLTAAIRVQAQSIRQFGLTGSSVLAPGSPLHDISSISVNSAGLVVNVDGADPYFFLKSHDYPAGMRLWIKMTIVSPHAGTGRFYFFHHAASERHDLHFDVTHGMQTIYLPLPAMGAHTSFRIDPPPGHYQFHLTSFAVEGRTIIRVPTWTEPSVPVLGKRPLQIRSGGLQILQAHHQLGAFVVNYDGYRMACGQDNEKIGYMLNGKPVFFDPNNEGITTVVNEQGVLHLRTVAIDPDGARWELHQTFRGKADDCIEVDCSAQVSEPRDILYLPFFVMLPGLGSFGIHRQQALFSGVEYLNAVDASSSDKDLKGPQAQRQIPPSSDITIPLMAIAANNRVLSLTWQPADDIAAEFDSPDRLPHTAAHLMAIISPGTGGMGRPAGHILPYEATHLAANHVIFANVTVMGARGATIVPALSQYITTHGLPPIPSPGLSRTDYLNLAAAGWLHSPISHIPLFQHAYNGSGFPPQIAPDAATELAYIASNINTPALCQPLNAAYQKAIAVVPPSQFTTTGIFHVRTLAPALVAGKALDAARECELQANQELSAMEKDEHAIYTPPVNGENLAATNPHRYTDGLDAERVLPLLENAAFCGSEGLIRGALKMLDRLDQYKTSVPRGAQTWEVPLHVPDILAAADLCKCYTLGYMLSGRKQYLQQAEYWAWTGIPFVYLHQPESRRIGFYATTAVLGATHWVSPDWIGLPVQWCGMVYADALHLLAREDHDAQWDHIADGITACGLQMTWPMDSPLHGLLPDSFNLVTQTRNLPAINPGTVFSGAIPYYHLPPLYQMTVCRKCRAIIHVPGRIRLVNDSKGSVSFHAEGWPVGQYDVLITGISSQPRVVINGAKVSLEKGYRYDAVHGWLALRLEGKPTIALRWR